MADYREMYGILFRAITQAIYVLQEAQCKTEELYVSCEEPILRTIDIARVNVSENEK